MNIEMAKFRRDRMMDIRSFFLNRDCLEVEVPLMGRGVGTDPYLDYFETTDDKGQPFYFHTSPEFFLKRLLAQGYPDIFYLGPTFRKNEVGSRHLPQFTILEWYRKGWDLKQLKKEVIELVNAIYPESKSFSLIEKSYADLFLEIGLNIYQSEVSDLNAFILKSNKDQSSLKFVDKLEALDFIYVSHIEPKLKVGAMLIVHSYLPEQAALAKVVSNKEGKSVALRFELYLHGVEICNAYQELTDVVEQEFRFNEDLKKRKSLQKDLPNIDREFLKDLQLGLPESCGVALGVDRLLMLCKQKVNISSVISFDINSW